MKRRPWIKFIGYDTPQHILWNCSWIGFPIACLSFLLPVALWSAYMATGTQPFLFLLGGVWLVVWFLRYQPLNPFFISELWMKRRMQVAELDEPARRVLTFFQSPKAWRMHLGIAWAFTIVVVLAWGLCTFILPKPDLPVAVQAKLVEHRLGGSLGAGLILGIATLGMSTALVCGHARKHWDRLQREYPPWPVDKPYPNLLWSKTGRQFGDFDLWWWLLVLGLVGYFVWKRWSGGQSP